MQIFENINTVKSTNFKVKTFAIALILILSMSAALAIMSTGKAQVTGIGGAATYTYTPTKGQNGLWNIPSFAGITAAPDPVGVGQPIQVIMLIEQLPPSQGYEAVNGTTGGWEGLTLTVTDPNGNKTTLGPYESDVSGTYQVTYTPDMTGTYSFQFSWPGETVGAPGSVQGTSTFVQYWGNFLGATSNTATVTVTNTPAPGYTEAPVPLPNAYWDRTNVNSQNRAWNVICGPYLQSGYNATGNYNPYSDPVMSAHILWTQLPYIMTCQSGAETSGGLAGGQYGSLGIVGQNASPSGYSLACVMDGFAYYNGPTQNANVTTGGVVYNQAVSYFYCQDIQTGQIVWSAPGSITCGQMLCQRAQQSKQIDPYLWSITTGSYKMYSASTGALLMEWHNLAAGATVYNSTEINSMSVQTVVPGVATKSVSVLSGTVVEEQPNPAIVGEDVGYSAGGGALLVYIYQGPGAGTGIAASSPVGYLSCWNSSLAIDSIANDPTGQPGTGGFTIALPSVTAQETTTPLDWNWGLMYNITVPLESTTSATPDGQTATSSLAAWSLIGCDGQYAILQTGKSSGNATGSNYRTLAAINVGAQPETAIYSNNDVGGVVTPNTAGTFAWVENYSLPNYDQTYTGSAVLLNQGNIIVPDTPLLTLWDFSESTGALLWTSTPFNNDFAMQSISTGTVAAGMLYDPGYDGYMHAINTTTGAQTWDSISVAGGTEMPQPAYPMSGSVVAGAPGNTVVYSSTRKSYEAEPLYRGHMLIAYNGETGAQLWNISGEFSLYGVDDGVLIGANNYDNTVYAFGSGPSATTVTAPQTSVTAGSNVVIQGTVTDQTPGLLKGTPAISDNYMGAWMAYMYMDQAMPTTATGVTVQLSAIDPNGNYVQIGNATSDTTGIYHLTWTPQDIPGTYTIISTFAGTNSYAGSCSETSMTIASPSTTTAPTATPTSVADMYFVPAIAGLFVLIIVGLVVLALLMLRKHP